MHYCFVHKAGILVVLGVVVRLVWYEVDDYLRSQWKTISTVRHLEGVLKACQRSKRRRRGYLLGCQPHVPFRANKIHTYFVVGWSLASGMGQKISTDGALSSNFRPYEIPIPLLCLESRLSLPGHRRRAHSNLQTGVLVVLYRVEVGSRFERIGTPPKT